MAGEWLEVVSDPGLFTLLLKDFGVRGVQLREIYDVEQPVDGPVYGVLFLFKWSSETRRPGRPRKNADNKPTTAVGTYVEDDDAVRGMFFARQMVPNSCATHALLSVLLNTDARLHLGETLERLKERTRGLDPETKGWAIGNTPELARAHNSRAVPERDADRWHAAAAAVTKRASVPKNVRYVERDTYHYVSYVPIGGRLYELDGLKPYPTDHGPWAEGEDWTAKFRRIVAARMAAGVDTGYNLMAVVPDQRMVITRKLDTLTANRLIVLEVLQERTFKMIVMKVDGDPSSDERTEREEPSPVAVTPKQLMEAKEPSPNERTEKEYSPVAGTSKDFIEATECTKYNNNIEIPVQSPSNGAEDVDTLLQLESPFKVNPFTPIELLRLAQSLTQEIGKFQDLLQEENQKQRQYETDSVRRVHDYFPFINTFLTMLAEQRMLPNLIQGELAAQKKTAREQKRSPSTTSKKQGAKKKP